MESRRADIRDLIEADHRNWDNDGRVTDPADVCLRARGALKLAR